MIRVILLAIALAVTWLIWSGLYKPLLLGLGLLSVMLAVWLAWRMELMRRDVFTLDLVPRLLAYWAWLAVEIVRSNLAVARIVLSPGLPISPTRAQVTAPDGMGRIGRATLANSITLTPGTLTVDAHEGRLEVHCLTREGAQALAESEFGQRIKRAVGDR